MGPLRGGLGRLGIPYLFIKVAVDGGVSPFGVAWGRVVLGAVVLVAIAWRSGTLGQLRGSGRWLVVYALIEIAFPFTLIPAGETRVDSSVAAILIASAPLMVAALAIRFEPAERADRRRLGGLLLGFAGVAALVGIDVTGSGGEALGAAAILLAALGYAGAAMVLKRHLSHVDPIAAMGACLILAAIPLTPFAAFGGFGGTVEAGAIWSIVVLGLVCTAAGLVLAALLVTEVGPARALVITYVNPVVAVALGIAFLGETPGLGTYAGLALILAGSWLSTRPTAVPPPLEVAP